MTLEEFIDKSMEEARFEDYDDEAYSDLECPVCREVSETDEEFLNHECKENGDY